MKEKLYNLMSEFNDIIGDIDCLADAIEVHFDGIVENYGCEKARSLLSVYLSVVRGIKEDCEELYNKIDQTILDMKKERK